LLLLGITGIGYRVQHRHCLTYVDLFCEVTHILSFQNYRLAACRPGVHLLDCELDISSIKITQWYELRLELLGRLGDRDWPGG